MVVSHILLCLAAQFTTMSPDSELPKPLDESVVLWVCTVNFVYTYMDNTYV